MGVLNYSIIVPYRDKYNLFVTAINSIPDRKDIQIIIVDNALEPLLPRQIPTKNHAEITYANSSTTGGAGCARNEGLRHVEGRFVLFLDADDYYTSLAFPAFDRYLNEDYDIIFFNTTSIRLDDGCLSTRHVALSSYLKKWSISGNEDCIRYRWAGPVAKMYNAEFLCNGDFKFEEKPVCDDEWFSVITGHSAAKLFGDMTVVYVITEGNPGESLTKTVTRENAFVSYCTRIQINQFLKSIGRYDLRIRLLGSLRFALTHFGVLEMFRYLRVARKKKIGVF